MNKKKPIYLAIMAMLILPFNAFALSENPNAIVAQYPSGFTVGEIQTTNCTSPSYADCVVINKSSGNSVLYKNTNGSLSTLYSPATLDVLGIKSDYTLPTGFSSTQVGENGYWLLKTTEAISDLNIQKGKLKMNTKYICVYDRNTQVMDSYPYPRRLVAGFFSDSLDYVCPGTYNGFNLIDFYGLNPYVAQNPNPCGLTQAEIDAGVTCGGNDSGSGSTDSNTELPMTEAEYREFQSVKIGVSLLILGVICVLSGIKYATND